MLLPARLAHLLFLAFAGQIASARTPDRVAVLPFTARSLDQESLEGIVSALNSNILQLGTVRVMERSQIESILREQSLQQSGACDQSECAVEVGKLLSVDRIVIGSISRIGNALSVSARLVDVSTGEVVRSSTRNSPSTEIESVLTGILPGIASDLVGKMEASPTRSTYPSGSARRELGPDSFMDSRDGRVYRTIELAGHRWMAENLDHNMAGSTCYQYLARNCEQYGRLYQWDAANNACPNGWELPSEAAWVALGELAGNDHGRSLQAAEGWLQGGGQGTDRTRFTARPAGMMNQKEEFLGLGGGAYFWTAPSFNSRYLEGGRVGDRIWYLFRGSPTTKAVAIRCVESR